MDKNASAETQDGDSSEGGGSDRKLPWSHVEFVGFDPASRPGGPEGGGDQGLRALYALLDDMFGAKVGEG